MLYLLFFIIKLIFRFPLFKISLLLVILVLYLPEKAHAQFHSNPKPLLEASGNISVGSYYVHAIPQLIPGYQVKAEYGYLFFHGQPPFTFSSGLFFEDSAPYDPRLVTRLNIFYSNTNGRAVDRDTSLARTVGSETYIGISYRRRLWRNLLATELETQQELGQGTSHSGRKASLGISFRFLTFSTAKFYIARYIFYGDKDYIDVYFDTRAAFPNIPLSGGLYETQDRLTVASDLGSRLFFEVDFKRGSLLGSAKHSYASLTSQDNSFSAAVGYRY